MLGHSVDFTYFNPSGHYKLKLSNTLDRELALSLMLIDLEHSKKIARGERTDRSQKGNKSCLRNEVINGLTIMDGYKPGEFILPTQGFFEFDFVFLPHNDPLLTLSDLELENTLKFFQEYGSSVDISTMIRGYRVFSEYLTLTCEQLGLILDLFDGKI
jgi:hypothetical protein